MITRRSFLRMIGGMALAPIAVAFYGVIVEPFWRLRVTRYSFSPPGWPQDFPLRIAVIADPHICWPWMDLARIAHIVETTNELAPDLVMLLGDYTPGVAHQRPILSRDWAEALAKLRAPLGVHAVLGNHDWWSDRPAMERGDGLPRAGLALQEAGIKVYQNDAAKLTKDGRSFWIAGLGDMLAFLPIRKRNKQRRMGIDDLASCLSQATDPSPILLMAHEPDIFPRVPARVALTISGHTHGGQLNLFGWTPFTSSRYGTRFVYGHKIEQDRHIVTSGGLGCSVVPMRIGRPPEIVLLELGQTTRA